MSTKPSDPTPTPEPVAAPAPPPALKQAVEKWAEAKGYLPEFSAGGQVRLTREIANPTMLVTGIGGVLAGSARRSNPKFWKYAAAQGLCNWVIGAEVTEAEFDAAIERATNQPI